MLPVFLYKDGKSAGKPVKTTERGEFWKILGKASQVPIYIGYIKGTVACMFFSLLASYLG
jgi:hypothetical protein